MEVAMNIINLSALRILLRMQCAVKNDKRTSFKHLLAMIV